MSSRSRFRFVAGIGAILAFFLVAATPAETIPDLSTQGYFIEEGSGATDECVSGAVSDARASGGNLFISVLADEPGGGATTFAGNTLDALDVDGTVFVVAPETVGWESQGDVWTTDELNDAVDAALEGSSDDDVVRRFVNSLTGDDFECTSAAASGGGGSGWIFLIILVVIIGGIVFLVVRSSKKTSQDRRDGVAAKVQAQIDDIANDILELEGEVRQSGNAEAIEHFDAATAQFTTASDRLAAATDSVAVMDLSYDLDVAIWHLDSAEAIIDGNPVPEKPVKPAPPPPPTTRVQPTPQPTATADDLPDRLERRPSGISGDLPPQLPEYGRRQSRASSYGSNEVLAAILAAQAMGGLGGGGSRSPSKRSSSGSSRRRSGGRTRGGGRRRG